MLPLPDPENTLDILLEALNQLVEFDLAVVLSLEDNERLIVRKSRGTLNIPELKTFQIALEERKDLAEVLREGKAVLYDETRQHADTYEDVLKLPQNHSCLVSPLMIDRRAVGLLTLDHRQCGRYDPAMVNFIEVISNLISINLNYIDASEYLTRQNRELLREQGNRPLYQEKILSRLIGQSRAWGKVLDHIRLVADSSVPVLIQGETGTGKELTARAIHDLSDRSSGPFVALNCSALTASLAESELFGHEKGAFTGALQQRKGRFELARGGTLFLDEIGDLPLEIQPKLLRVIQEGTFERVGGERTLSVDVRIIAASHIHLESAVAHHRFREDLFYRLSLFPIYLPALRDRAEDIFLLADHILRNIGKRKKLNLIGLSPQAQRFLMEHSWPGNIRELQNRLERGVLLSSGGLIERNHLMPEEYRGEEISLVKEDSIPLWSEMEKKYFYRVLEQSEHKIYGPGGAAEITGLKPTTLQSRLKKLGLK